MAVTVTRVDALSAIVARATASSTREGYGGPASMAETAIVAGWAAAT